MSTTTPTTKSGFGEALASARKKKSMSIDTVATELNILKRYVEAMENEDYSALPEKAFARGFVMNYAKLVGLDGEEITRQFLAGHPTAGDVFVSPMSPMGTLHRGRAPIRLNLGLIVGVIALLVLAVAILKMISGATNNDSVAPSEGTTVVDTLSPSERAQGATIGNAGSALAGVNTGVTDSQSASVPPAPASGAGVLDFWVKAPVVISVTDSTGKSLMSGKQNRGGYELSGKPPFKVEIENPSSVDLNYNKNPVTLTEKTITLQ